MPSATDSGNQYQKFFDIDYIEIFSGFQEITFFENFLAIGSTNKFRWLFLSRFKEFLKLALFFAP